MQLKSYQKIILGIDPGTNIMGYGVIGIKGGKPCFLDMGTVNLKKLDDSYLKLDGIFKAVISLVEHYMPDEMAIEAPFYGKNVQSMLKLGRAQGVAIAAALARDIPIREYEPRKVKLSVTGRGGATKEQVREMLVRMLDIPMEHQITPLDATDALAIALCHHFESSRQFVASASKDWKDYIRQHPEKIIR